MTVRTLPDLPFPILFATDGGWVERAAGPADLVLWNMRGIRRFSKIPVTILDSESRPWRVTSIEPARPPTLVERITGRMIPAIIHIEHVNADGASAFRAALDRALEADDDVLTQWEDAETISARIKDCTDFAAFDHVLGEMRVI